jgi:hypothetical protein
LYFSLYNNLYYNVETVLTIVDVRFMRMERVVRDVGGARNPYALAEYLLGTGIDWNTKSPTEVRQIMEKAFSRPYEKLFSPEHESPLYEPLSGLQRRER